MAQLQYLVLNEISLSQSYYLQSYRKKVTPRYTMISSVFFKQCWRQTMN